MPEEKAEQKSKIEKKDKAVQTQTEIKEVSNETIFDGYLAEVVDVVKGRTGIYGEIKQAMCKIMEGKDKGRVIRRNFAGKIQKGDIIRLPDTSREDKRIIAR
ncbi:MAG: 30S ribosomal protein S28e [Candidatus Micrarchaeia archaeon]